jgi:hypothetical protein
MHCGGMRAWRGILLVRTGSSSGTRLKPKYEPMYTSGTETQNQRKQSASMVLNGTAPLLSWPQMSRSSMKNTELVTPGNSSAVRSVMCRHASPRICTRAASRVRGLRMHACHAPRSHLPVQPARSVPAEQAHEHKEQQHG